MKTFTFQRQNDGAYDVASDGKKLGSVYRAWTRLGGWGWTHDSKATYTTRTDAAKSLLRALTAKR